MSHPDPNAAPDLTPIKVGEVFENPVTGEVAKILKLPWTNPEGRGVAELTALVGARVVGEHRHPATVERFTVLEGELTVKLDGEIGCTWPSRSPTSCGTAAAGGTAPAGSTLVVASRSHRWGPGGGRRPLRQGASRRASRRWHGDRRRSPCHARVSGCPAGR